MANNVQDQILFTGGLDQDSDEKFVQQGDYVDALNIAKFYDGNAGLVTNANGNSEISNTYLPVGTNKCIGWCEDEESNAIIFFNYNSNNNHGIYRLLKDSGTFQKILHNESILAFSVDTVNLQAHVVGGKLYWNEGKDIDGNYINVPRKINISKAARYTNGWTGDKYVSITEYVLSVIKPPYLGYLNAVHGYDSDYNYLNKLKVGDFYKFAIQIIYDDYEHSVLGNYSNVVEIISDNSNYIGIRFFYKSKDSIVNKLRIYTSKNFIGAPFLIGDIDVLDTENVYDANDNNAISSLINDNYYVYRWYGDYYGGVYSGNTNLYDDVPMFANSMTITDNRLLYGGIDRTIDLGDKGEGSNVYIPIQYAAFNGIYDNTAFTSIYNDDTTKYNFIVENLLPTITDYIRINSTHFVHVLWEASTSVSGSSNGYVSFHMKIDARSIAPYWNYDKIVEYIELNAEVYALDASGERYEGNLSNSDADPIFSLKGEITDDGNISSINVTTNLIRFDKSNNLTYKSVSNRIFDVVYMDKYGRTLGYQSSNSTTYAAEDRLLLYNSPPYGGYGNITNFYWFAFPDIPSNSDVHYLSIVASDNLDIVGCWQLKTPTTTSPPAGDPIGVSYPLGYIFTEGDVLRIIGDSKLWKILSTDEDYVYVSNDFVLGSTAIGVNSIEILRLNNIEDIVYNEVRTWDVSDGVPPIDIAGLAYLLSDGDALMDINVDEDYIYETLLSDNNIPIRIGGRAFPERIEFEQTNFKHILYSNKYFDNTEINGLNTFIFGNRAELSDENGEIIDLKRVGEVLYVHQRREITSFYLGKAILKQSSTGEVTADTSQVLGGKRESAFGYGTTFKTARMDNNVYGFDIYKGVFWMNGYNGVQVISGKDVSGNYKMDAYFKAKSAALLESGIDNIRLLIGVDKPNDTIYVTFIDESDSGNNETIAYHRPTNRWISKYSFIPEQYAWLDDKMYSLKSGKLYKHDDASADKCTYYGTAYDSYIQFVSHESPNLIKVFNSIGIHADSQWTVDPIEIQPNSNYPNGMYSKIIDSEFIEEEGVYRAAFNRNMKSRSSLVTNYDLRNGNALRGYVIKCKLTNSDTTEAKLFKVDINGVISK